MSLLPQGPQQTEIQEINGFNIFILLFKTSLPAYFMSVYISTAFYFACILTFSRYEAWFYAFLVPTKEASRLWSCRQYGS